MTIEQFRIDGTTEDVTPPPAPEPLFWEATPPGRLREAATYIRGHWTRRALSDPDGNVCAVGSIIGLRKSTKDGAMDLLDQDRLADEALTVLARYLYAHVDTGLDPDHYRVGLVATWNDGLAIDAEDVASTMEKAAAWWEEQRG
jgi:hypothetical protein